MPLLSLYQDDLGALEDSLDNLELKRRAFSVKERVLHSGISNLKQDFAGSSAPAVPGVHGESAGELLTHDEITRMERVIAAYKASKLATTEGRTIPRTASKGST